MLGSPRGLKFVTQLPGCARAARDGRAVHLDLAGVIYLDTGGAALVARLERQGIRLVRCPDVIRQILEEHP